MNRPLSMSMESTTHNLVPGKMSTSASAASPCNIEYRAMSTPRFASMSAQCSRLERLCVRPTIVHSCIRAFNTGRCLEKCDMADLEARRAGAEDAELYLPTFSHLLIVNKRFSLSDVVQINRTKLHYIEASAGDDMLRQSFIKVVLIYCLPPAHSRRRHAAAAAPPSHPGTHTQLHQLN